MRQTEVNSNLAERLKKLASLPISGFVCYYKLDDEFYTDVGGLEHNVIQEILEKLEE